MEILKRIDYFGGLLSISGLLLLNMGLQWGGYQYPWKGVHVLVPLILGAVLLIAFGLWEAWGAKYPIFPSGLKKEPRILALTLVITFISGANFFSVLMFWPTQAFNVYGHNPIGVGVRGIPIGFSILAGACVVLWLLSALRGYNRELLFVSSIIMTAGCGSLAVADLNNLNTVFGLLVIAGFGIGGIVVPASIISTIICPDELIATISALTLAIRVVGGSIGYTTYYNVFISKFIPKATKLIGTAMFEMGIANTTLIKEAIVLTGASLLDGIKEIPGVDTEEKYSTIVRAGQEAYAESYKYVYLTSIAFGAVAIIASLLMKNINKLMVDRVAVIIH